MAKYHAAGAKGVLIKATEGTWYKSPVAGAQVKSAHKYHMFVHIYHFATFGSSVSRAKAEAKIFVARAEYLGISKKRYLPCDWEVGDGNNVYGGKVASAKAIIAFMEVCAKAGYKVLLYSGASLLRNNIDTARIVKKFGTCIWVAAYPRSGAVSTPDFNYFPSMDGVAVWQFTDNWHGLNVDGNISLIDLHKDSSAKKPTSKPVEKPKPKPVKKVSEVYAPIIHGDPKWSIRLLDGKGHYMRYLKTNSNWKVLDTKVIRGMKCYRLGTDEQWAPAKYFKVTKYK